MASLNRTKVLRRFHLSVVAFTAAMAITAASVAAPPKGSRFPERGGATGTETRQVPGFLLEKGRYVTIDVPRRLWETAPQGIGPIGINDHEQIVGSYEDNSGMVHGFLLDRRGGGFANIDVPGALGTQAEDINSRGQIVGAATTENSNVATPAQGFILAKGIGGRFTPLDRPGRPITLPFDINNRGQIVGVTVNDPPTSQGGGTSLTGAMSDVGRSAGSSHAALDAAPDRQPSPMRMPTMMRRMMLGL